MTYFGELHKKFILLFLVGLTLGIFLAACGGSEKSSTGETKEKGKDGNSNTLSGELNLLIWAEYLPDDIIKQFGEKYDVKVNYNTFASNEEMLAKIETGGAGYDIVMADNRMAEIMTKLDLLETIDLNHIPNFKNLDEEYLDLGFDPGNKYTVPYMSGTVVIAVNTDKVDTVVESYEDLMKPEFMNSLVVLDSQRFIIGIANAIQGESINATDKDVLKKSQEILKDFLPNVKAFDSDSPKTMLANGEAKAGIVWGAESYLAQKDNPAIKTILPKEGLLRYIDNFAIPKGAKNKNAAEAFINYILDPEVSAKISDDFPYSNPNKEARKLIDEDVQKDPAVYPPAEELAKGEFATVLEDDAVLEYDRIWAELKVQ